MKKRGISKLVPNLKSLEDLVAVDRDLVSFHYLSLRVMFLKQAEVILAQSNRPMCFEQPVELFVVDVPTVRFLNEQKLQLTINRDKRDVLNDIAI